MMRPSLVFSRHHPPRRSPRPVLAGLGIAAVTAVAGLAFLFLYPKPPLPEEAVTRARAALAEAHQQAAELAAAELARAVALGDSLEHRFAAERARLFRFRRPVELEQLAAGTERAAQAAAQKARETRSGALLSAQRQRARLEEIRADLATRVQLLPGDRRLRQSFGKAELALEQARGAQRRGDLQLLARSLDTAEEELDRTQSMLDHRFARLHDPGLRQRWQSWVNDTVKATRGGGSAIVVEKFGRRLCLVRGGRVVAEYHAELGRNGFDDKAYAGDAATPEGRYRIKEKRQNGATRWYKALVIDYPNADDWAQYRRARKRGDVPRGLGIGSLIEIHGHGGKGTNWTSGCVAIRNEHLDALYSRVSVGTPVTIVGAARLPGDDFKGAGTE